MGSKIYKMRNPTNSNNNRGSENNKNNRNNNFQKGFNKILKTPKLQKMLSNSNNTLKYLKIMENKLDKNNSTHITLDNLYTLSRLFKKHKSNGNNGNIKNMLYKIISDIRRKIRTIIIEYENYTYIHNEVEKFINIAIQNIFAIKEISEIDNKNKKTVNQILNNKYTITFVNGKKMAYLDIEEPPENKKPPKKYKHEVILMLNNNDFSSATYNFNNIAELKGLVKDKYISILDYKIKEHNNAIQRGKMKINKFGKNYNWAKNNISKFNIKMSHYKNIKKYIEDNNNSIIIKLNENEINKIPEVLNKNMTLYSNINKLFILNASIRSGGKRKKVTKRKSKKKTTKKVKVKSGYKRMKKNGVVWYKNVKTGKRVLKKTATK